MVWDTRCNSLAFTLSDFIKVFCIIVCALHIYCCFVGKRKKTNVALLMRKDLKTKYHTYIFTREMSLTLTCFVEYKYNGF